ncbi:MAG: hypothetical protein K6C40_10105 [Thermoguttaceae bacterium]|nr:hypothetical protein [Thermoguttaceae bacterium]
MKKFLGCILSVLLFLVLLVGGLGLWFWHAAKQVPDFYKELEVSQESRQDAEKDSQAMEQKVQSLRHRMKLGRIWILEFSQDELNHWLAIAIGEKRPGMIPHQLKNPRCKIFSDRIQAGVMVDAPEYKGVVSLECVPKIPEPNVVEVELLSVSAGSVKMPGKLFQKIIRRGAESASLPVEVLDRNGKMVIRMPLRKGDLAFEKHIIQVNTLTFKDAKIMITGTIVDEVKD